MDSYVILRGRLAGDPVRGDDGTLFLLATEATLVGEQVPRRVIAGEAEWCDVIAAGTLGRHVEASLIDGDQVIVAGRLRVHATGAPAAVRITVDAALVGHDLAHGVSRFIPAEQLAELG